MQWHFYIRYFRVRDVQTPTYKSANDRGRVVEEDSLPQSVSSAQATNRVRTTSFFVFIGIVATYLSQLSAKLGLCGMPQYCQHFLPPRYLATCLSSKVLPS
jgi:hypothetical protein